jgi:lipid-binding SYLF domain-containing protein
MKAIVPKLAHAAALALASLTLSHCASGPVAAFNAAGVPPEALANDSRSTLKKLYAHNSIARKLGPKAKGILVFPKITKGGFMVGGMAGNGALISPDGGVRSFYQTSGLSYGYQAGIQEYSYALFLMDDKSLAELNRDGGWVIGSSPSLVIVNEGTNPTIATGNLASGTYAFLFNPKGLMASLGLQGSNITRIHLPR